MRILYVDSRTRLARAACRDLPHDTDVILVATAAEAERAARHGQFDAVIADYDLPGVNGSELVRRLREAGYFEEPVEPWETALHVRDAPDRAAALAALHPEEREAVELLLSR